MNLLHKRGVTILEFIIVFAVIIILTVVALPSFSRIRESQVAKAATNDVLSSLAKARSETLASVNSSEYGVHFESDKVIIFSGKVFSSGASDNEIIDIYSPATISTISLTGGAVDMYFNRLTGAPSVTGSIIISSPNFSKTITISATGSASPN